MADIEINLESTDSKELLKCGHHALVIKDYANAAAALGKATQIMAQEHGDEHDSLGEVYLHYARALLELVRDESEPLGDAIPQGEDEDSDEEEEGEGEENAEENGEEAEAENQENEKNEEKVTKDKKEDVESEEKESESKTEEPKAEEPKAEETKTEDKSAEAETEKSEEKMEAETNGTDKTEEKLTNGHAEPGPSTSNGTTEENAEPTEENNEPSDLQIAWEVLEVAKKIFTARGENGKELLSQTHILLGEVGMESENFNDAVTDIKTGLEIQETLYEKTNRKLAESYYKLGMAQGTISNFDEAVKCFEKSIDILKLRIESLKGKGDDESNKKEIAEMEELLPEIQEKINDMHTVREETEKVKAEMAEACSTKLEKKIEQSPTSSKEVKDISHLVKRKRKIEEESPECPQPAKKPTP